MVLINTSYLLTSTTPSAPFKGGCAPFFDIASTPPQLRRGTSSHDSSSTSVVFVIQAKNDEIKNTQVSYRQISQPRISRVQY